MNPLKKWVLEKISNKTDKELIQILNDLFLKLSTLDRELFKTYIGIVVIPWYQGITGIPQFTASFIKRLVCQELETMLSVVSWVSDNYMNETFRVNRVFPAYENNNLEIFVEVYSQDLLLRMSLNKLLLDFIPQQSFIFKQLDS